MLHLTTRHPDGRALQVDLGHLSTAQRRSLPGIFASFLDAATTATSRATFYNTREEQERALDETHTTLLALDRGLYAAALLLPGVTDRTRQLGARRLFAARRTAPAFLTHEEERLVLNRLAAELPPQRLLNLCLEMRATGVNNARTRKWILSRLLGSRALELWAVKYRRKLRAALTHAWGRNVAGAVRSILGKAVDDRNAKERAILDRQIGRYLSANGRVDSRNRATAEECVRFVFGDESNLTLKRLSAYTAAKRDFQQGCELPYEVLEGIRSRFHKNRTSAETLDLTSKQLTQGQQIALQRKAQKADVDVEFDPSKYDAVRLYLYAFEMGMTDEVRTALEHKAKQLADRLPMRFEHVGVLLDTSASMYGHATQRRRPIATALALRDVLCATANRSTVLAADGQPLPPQELVEPRGDTLLASGLVALLRSSPEAIFIVSDGYENAPAGRTDELIHAARRLGISTPIFQLTPVFAAESQTVRVLSAHAPAMPVSQPEAVGLGLLKATFEIDVERGAAALLTMIGPMVPSALAHSTRSITKTPVIDHVRQEKK